MSKICPLLINAARIKYETRSWIIFGYAVHVFAADAPSIIPSLGGPGGNFGSAMCKTKEPEYTLLLFLSPTYISVVCLRKKVAFAVLAHGLISPSKFPEQEYFDYICLL
jgi:hypothetical protein